MTVRCTQCGARRAGIQTGLCAACVPMPPLRRPLRYAAMAIRADAARKALAATEEPTS